MSNSSEFIQVSNAASGTVSAASKTTASMSTDPEDKQLIASILGIPNTNDWEIRDRKGVLRLVHYTDKADLSLFGNIRGIVVDLDAKTAVCRSFGYTPVVTADELVVNSEGQYDLVDVFGVRHQASPQNSVIRTGIEGTVMRVFLHGGEVYYSSHKKLDTEKSTWGQSIGFKEMYDTLGGPTRNDLFDPLSDYSPDCYVFLMVHPDVLYVTKDNVGNGYLVHLGTYKMWSTDPMTCPYKQTDQNGRPLAMPVGVPVGVQSQYSESWDSDPRPNGGWINPTSPVLQNVVTSLTENSLNPIMYSPPAINLPEANHHLRYGFYQPYDTSVLGDRRLGSGEFIMLYVTDEHENGQRSTRLIKVQSHAYGWRADMRDNNPNLNHQFCKLLDGPFIRAKQSADAQISYQQKFPLLTRYTIESIIRRIENEGAFVVWPQGVIADDLIETPIDRITNIWRAFLMAVPLHRQEEVSHFYNNYITSREQVITWLVKLENAADVGVGSGGAGGGGAVAAVGGVVGGGAVGGADVGGADVGVQGEPGAPELPRVTQILAQARESASKRIQSGQNIDRFNRKLTHKALTRTNIRNMVMKENGSSLYKMVKAMRAQEREKIEKVV